MTDDNRNGTPDAEPTEQAPTFQQELTRLINKHSREQFSGTPDWIIAEYLMRCLRNFDTTVKMRADSRGESVEYRPGKL